jgi:hypothetical protein
MKGRRGRVIEWICQKPKTNLPAYSLMHRVIVLHERAHSHIKPRPRGQLGQLWEPARDSGVSDDIIPG